MLRAVFLPRRLPMLLREHNMGHGDGGIASREVRRSDYRTRLAPGYKPRSRGGQATHRPGFRHGGNRVVLQLPTENAVVEVEPNLFHPRPANSNQPIKRTALWTIAQVNLPHTQILLAHLALINLGNRKIRGTRQARG